MGDRTTASIRIGGKIKRSDLETLFEAIDAECMEPDFGGGNIETVEELVERIEDLGEDESLYMGAYEVNYGTFETLESTLQELGLTYVRHNDEGGGYSAGLSFWEYGMKEPEDISSNRDHDALLTCREVRQALKNGTLEEELHRLEHIENLKLRLEIVEDDALIVHESSIRAVKALEGQGAAE